MNLSNKIYHTQTQYHTCYLCALTVIKISDFQKEVEVNVIWRWQKEVSFTSDSLRRNPMFNDTQGAELQKHVWLKQGSPTPSDEYLIADQTEHVQMHATHCTTRITKHTCYMYCCHNAGVDRREFKFSVSNFKILKKF